MWPSHVLIEVTKVIKIKFFEFFLLSLKLTNVICLEILSDLSQFGNSLAWCKYALRENLHKCSRIKATFVSNIFFWLWPGFCTLGNFFLYLLVNERPIRDLLCTEWDLPKREDRFMSLEWNNRKWSLNQLHECKSRTRWVMYYIDYGDGANYHPLPLLETVAAVAYFNLVIVKREWRNLI